MKRLLVCMLAILCLTSNRAIAGEMERIIQKGEVVISLNNGYPPFAIVEKDSLQGLDVDLGTMIAEHLGVKARFIIPERYRDQIPKLLAGESDIIIAAMTRTVERGLQVNFSASYFEVSQAALVNRKLVAPQDDSYFDLVDIAGIRIGVKADTTIERFARELFPADAVITYPDHPQAVDALLNGKVDATVHDSPYVNAWVATHPEAANRIKPLLTPVTKEYYAFAIRKGDPDFLNWLNLFITQVHIDGTMDLLKHRYFVEMQWAGIKPTREAHLTKAQLMRNKFIAEKQKKLEEKYLKERIQRGEAYD